MATWAITGGSGFLGLHLVRRLLVAGEVVRSLDLLPLDEPDAHGIVGDIRDPARVRELCSGADVLVHAAAALPIRRAEIREVNVDGTATVLAAALGGGVRRVVFVSSAAVYGIQDRPPAPEDTPTAPIEPYGRSKVDAEAVCRAFAGRGLEVVVLRPQPFVGPGRLGVFGILFAWIEEGRRIYVLGSGTSRYQLLAVGDLVDAVLRAASSPVAGETFNVGAARFASAGEDLRRLIEHAGSRSRVVRVPAGPARAVLRGLDAAGFSPLSAWHYRTADKDVFVDVAKAETLLGWRSTRSSVETLIEAYDWYRTIAGSSPTGRGWRGGVSVGGRVDNGAGATHRVAWNQRALGLVRRIS